jgi:L-iditol 2-dehydrogenase
MQSTKEHPMTEGEIPTSSRAAVLETYGEPLKMMKLPVPELEPRSLLIKIEAASVCGSDVHFWQGRLAAGLSLELPTMPGHEGVGRIIAFGEGEQIDAMGAPLVIGDRVIWAHAPCGHCEMCNAEQSPELCPNLRVGYLSSCAKPPYIAGTFGEYAYIMPKAPRVKVPESVPSRWATAASCALRSVVHSFGRLGTVEPHQTVVVQGSGAVGLFATAMAAVRGPRRIIVIGDPADRLEIARAWGADLTVSVAAHPEPGDRVAAVREATNGDGAEIVMDMAGAPGAFSEGLQMLKRNGRYLVMGTTGGAPQEVQANLIVTRGLRIVGSFGANIGDYHRALGFLDQYRDRFDWDALLGSEYSLDDITLALEAVRQGTEIKPIIVPAGA